MLRWNGGIDLSCTFCEEPLENRSHLFFTYLYSAKVWSRLTNKIFSQKFTTRWDNVLKLLTDEYMGKDCLFSTRYTFQLTVHTL